MLRSCASDAIGYRESSIPSILEHVRAGRARALAMVGERSPLLPDVPTMAEAGLPGVDAALMFGLVAPAATPAAILKTLTGAAAACVRTDPLRSRLLELGYLPIGSTAQEFRARIAADIAKWSRIIDAAGIK